VTTALSPREEQWLDLYKLREARWKSGKAAQPLDGVFRRYEIPPGSWVGGPVPMPLIDALHRIDPDLEVIYDKFTTVNGCNGSGPAFHLVHRKGKAPSRSGDLLCFEFSLQWDVLTDIHRGWPHGVPAPPGMWLIKALRKFYVGDQSAKDDPKRRKFVESFRDRSRAKRAKHIKEARDLELDVYKYDLQPKLPGDMIFGGRGREMQTVPGLKR
jgi:hypothetical protein